VDIMLDIEELREQMRKHRDIKQEFETEWSKVLSVAKCAKDNIGEASAPTREMEQLRISLVERFSKE
jgi:hypothetical protein